VSEGSLVSTALRQRVRGLAEPIGRGLGRVGLTPNALTLIGFAGTCGAAVAAAERQWAVAGILVLVFGIFDLFDGALARATGRTSAFGAFLDSTLDRTGENLVYVGVTVGAMVAGSSVEAVLAMLALAFASTVTYTRAKAESLGLRGDVGVAPRPERLILLSVGLVATGVIGLERGEPAPLGYALFIIAVASAATVLQRILHVKRQLESNASKGP
jgi:CDP-diacylglycerol---glycerol-3-phosphate 3-phosphatidyltransferase